MTDDLREVRLPDRDGLGEIRMTVWQTETGDDMTFRFDVYTNTDDEEPSDTFDVSPEDVLQLVVAAGGTAVKFLKERGVIA